MQDKCNFICFHRLILLITLFFCVVLHGQGTLRNYDPGLSTENINPVDSLTLDGKYTDISWGGYISFNFRVFNRPGVDFYIFGTNSENNLWMNFDKPSIVYNPSIYVANWSGNFIGVDLDNAISFTKGPGIPSCSVITIFMPEGSFALDAIVVPEPSELALFLIFFLIMGFVLGRKRA